MYHNSVEYQSCRGAGHWRSCSSENPLDYTWQLVRWLTWRVSDRSRLTWPRPRQGSHLVVILLEEVELLLQAVQVSPQGADELVVVRLCSPQSLTVPLHRLAQGRLCLPSSQKENSGEIKRRGKEIISRYVQHFYFLTQNSPWYRQLLANLLKGYNTNCKPTFQRELLLAQCRIWLNSGMCYKTHIDDLAQKLNVLIGFFSRHKSLLFFPCNKTI